MLTLVSFSSLYNLLICKLLPKKESVFIVIFLESLNEPVIDVDSPYSAFLVDRCSPTTPIAIPVEVSV